MPAAASPADATRALPGSARPSLDERRQAAQHRERGIALLAGVVVGLLVIVLVLGPKGKQPPPKAGVPPPSTPKPGTSNLEPGRDAAVADANAVTILKNISVCIGKKDWKKARHYLDRLNTKYGKTKFVATHRADIASLRQQIDAALKPRPAPPEPVAQHPEPPPPAPPKPEPPPDAKPAPWRVYAQWPFDAAEAKRRQEETAKALGVPVEQDIDLGGGVTLTMLLIPAGDFLMGSPEKPTAEELVKLYGGEEKEKRYQRERPQHRVKISRPFWLGKYEVTQEQWQAVTGANWSRFQGARNPVDRVSWHDRQTFLARLNGKVATKEGFRLPTEAEWEYACRAGTTTQFHFGNAEEQLSDYAWWSRNSEARAHPVGLKKPNRWGLYDMLGNVCEWCADWYGPYRAEGQTDPSGPARGRHRVWRGGSWYQGARRCRSACRVYHTPEGRYGSIGFRVRRPVGLRHTAVAPGPPRPAPEAQAGDDATAKAVAAYAGQSQKVWALFKERRYDEAEKLIEQLSARPEYKLAAGHIEADREAAKLLKEFWGAVEKGLSALKGRTLVIGGVGGTIVGVKGGVITIRTPKGRTATGRATDLAAKQAAAYSGLKDQPDARSKLVLAAFLLAEGIELDEAKDALAKAGGGPAVAIYRERLGTLMLGTREAAARAAWGRIERAAGGKLTRSAARRLEAMLGEFGKQHGQTQFYKGLREPLDSLKARIAKATGPTVYTKWPFDAAEARRRQKATAEALDVKVEQAIEIAKGVTMTLVLIPAGEFLMGSPPTTSPEKLAAAYFGGARRWVEVEFPQHRVKISHPFWLGKCEVTQEQFMAIMHTNPSANKDKPKNPVENVDWHQASGFATVLSEKSHKTFRLPTDAEREYACRAGTATESYFGETPKDLAENAWSGENRPWSTHPVGLKKPNAWGLFDMAGNVWEWCEDWYAPYESGAQIDPKGQPGSGLRLLRGGCFDDGFGNHRSAHRRPFPPGSRRTDLGFRVVLEQWPR